MNILFVVSHARDWPFTIPGVKVVPARLYLTDPVHADCSATRVFNLCKTYRYQSRGYYVSMLAEARGHHPLPDVKAIEDLHADRLLPILTEGMKLQIATALAHVEDEAFELPVYFGRTADRCHAQLGEQMFNLLRAPLLRLGFERCGPERQWNLSKVHVLHLDELSPEQMTLARDAATECAGEHRVRLREPSAQKPLLAILRGMPGRQELPSNPAALQKFQEAAEALGIRSELITHEDADRVEQFDALFIRDTTNVNDYTYQLARRAAVAGLVVMDDPDSILKCGNKIFLTEMLRRHHIPMPMTMMIDRDNLGQVIATLGLPCILKRPDGAFSLGVEKIESDTQLHERAQHLFETSDLLLAQEYLPTEFDWRIGVLDRRALFACRYFMAPGHWQVIRHEGDKATGEGRTEAVPLDRVPPQVLETAVRAANLIGNGFYGVDLKQRGQQCYVIEVNDNPNVDAGNEDGVLKDALYREVMGVFRKRIEAHKGSIA